MIEPVVKHAMPFAEYLATDAVSHSLLENVRRTPLYALAKKLRPDPSTPSMILGSAIHCAVLEPERFKKVYALQPPGDGRTKAVKEAREELAAAGFIPLKEEDWEACRMIPENIAKHPAAAKILEVATGREVSCFATLISESGIPMDCKIRPDAVCPEQFTVVDLKTTVDASPNGFPRQIYNMGYHRGAAFYLDVMRAYTDTKAGAKPYDTYCYIAIQNDLPYEVAVYVLTEEAVEVGRREYRADFDAWAKCVTKGDFTGFPLGIQNVGLPTWAR
jgi:exodeoxyribonuclease VIII